MALLGGGDWYTLAGALTDYGDRRAKDAVAEYTSYAGADATQIAHRYFPAMAPATPRLAQAITEYGDRRAYAARAVAIEEAAQLVDALARDGRLNEWAWEIIGFTAAAIRAIPAAEPSPERDDLIAHLRITHEGG